MIKKQKFGVEIEMTGITREKAAQTVANILGHRPSEPTENCYHTRTIKDQVAREWKIMRDSSISSEKNDETDFDYDKYKVELVTPPLQYEDIELLQSIIRSLRKAGAKTNNSCGIHIHIDGANHTPDSLKKLINFMIARQDLIYESLEITDRSNRWCKKLNIDLLSEMKKHKNLTTKIVEEIWYSSANDNYTAGISYQHYNETRYHGINLHAFFTKGTIEFRLFNSTLHAGKVKAYIQFCLALSAWAITAKDKVIFRSIDNYTPEQKVTIMRNILINRLELSGDEFKTCRLHLISPLKRAAGMTFRAA